MKSDYKKRLEAGIDQALKGLPELPAPGTLIPRVMAAIECRAAAPWYRRSWQQWPRALQAASLLILLVFFGGLCFAGWKLPQTGAVHQLGGWVAAVSVVWNALNVILGALALAIKQVGGRFMVVCLPALVLGYAMFVGLGTIYVRLAFTRR